MASADDHIALANRHQAALDALRGADGEHPEWLTVIAFYKALQIVDACLVTLGLGAPTDHGSRTVKMNSTRKLDHISGHYWSLKNAASVARYLSDVRGKGYRTFSSFLPTPKVESEMIGHRLVQIERSARKLLGPTLGGQLLPAVPPPTPTPKGGDPGR